MKTITSIAEIRQFIQPLYAEGKRIGLVPTMGALHDGHLKLVKTAREECDVVVVSIFVNPTQFNAGDDLKNYPRDLKSDAAMLVDIGVDAIFAPAIDEIYANQHATYIDIAGEMPGRLEGMSRPGHFRGVATIVCKLFNIVTPQMAYFGMKDAQQALIISRIVQDLNYNVELRLLPTVREKDGLAMSSRNRRLSTEQRKQAAVLHDTLEYARSRVDKGERDAMALLGEVYEMINSAGDVQIDYASFVRLPDLEEIQKLDGHVMLAVAVFFDEVRLIDNITIEIESGS